MNKHSIRFLAFSIWLAFAGASVLAADAIENRTIDAGSDEKTLNESWSVAADAHVEIENVRGSVAVSGWDKPQIELRGSLGAGSRLVISGDTGHLALRVDSKENGWFGKHGPDSDSELVVHVPRGSELGVQVVSADANVTDMGGKSIEVHGVSGTLGVHSSAPEVDVESVSGDVSFAAPQPNPSGHAHLQTVSGDITAKNLGGRIKLDTVSGDITLEDAPVQELETGTVSGDVRIHVTPAAHARLHLESMSGDIRLHLPDALSAHIDASTFSGDIHSDYGNAHSKDHGPGSSLKTSVGGGDADIEMQSFSGDLELRKQGG
jgi:DUF4097 and DUF4098 domain-containing protein YvlB